MKFFDTFSGIGGFTKGITDIIPNAECVGYSEIDKYAISIYKKHYPNHRNYGDITKINTAELPDFDLLVGGFPCQSFSIAGKRQGFEDTRGTMFFELARILKDKRPRHFIFENVKGLLSHEEGKTIQTIFGVLTDLGYEFQWQILNSKNFGVPQNRERIYIVGHLRGECRPKVFPITGTNPKTLEYEGGIVSGKKWVEGNSNLSRAFSQGNRVYSAKGIASTLASQAGGLGAKTGLYLVKNQNPHNPPSFIDLSTQDAKTTEHARALQARYAKGYPKRKGEVSGVFFPMQYRRSEEGKKKRYENQKNGKDYTPFGEKYRELVVNEEKEVIGTLTASAINKDSLIGNKKCIRRLTPLECERLQAFSDNWTKEGVSEKSEIVNISDTQRYKCCGNAVTVNVVKEIIKRLHE